MLAPLVESAGNRLAVREVAKSYDSIILELATLRLELAAKDAKIERLQPKRRRKAPKQTEDQQLWAIGDIIDEQIQHTATERERIERREERRRVLREVANITTSEKDDESLEDAISSSSDKEPPEAIEEDRGSESKGQAAVREASEAPIQLRSSRRLIRAPAHYRS